jgi:hypothetical protein
MKKEKKGSLAACRDPSTAHRPQIGKLAYCLGVELEGFAVEAAGLAAGLGAGLTAGLTAGFPGAVAAAPIR